MAWGISVSGIDAQGTRLVIIGCEFMGQKKWAKPKFLRRLKRWCKQIVGREVLVTINGSVPLHIIGDWGFNYKILCKSSVVYSFGVGDDIKLDHAIAKQVGCQVFCFDPTVDDAVFAEVRSKEGVDIKFYPWAVAGDNGSLRLYERLTSSGRPSGMYTLSTASAEDEEGIVVPALRVATIMAELNHAYVDLVKFDVEGAEYAAVAAMLDDGVLPAQVLIEFHHRFEGFSIADTRRILERLEGHGYSVVHVSETGRELSFQRGEPARSA